MILLSFIDNSCIFFIMIQWFRDTPEFKELHPTKNDLNYMNTLRKFSHKKAIFICYKSLCKKHVWTTRIKTRTNRKTGCPYCTNKKICPCDNHCNSLGYIFPELTLQWSNKNIKTPFDYTPGYTKNVIWKCYESKCNKHVWKATITNRTTRKTGCPYCANHTVCPCDNHCNSLGFIYPKLSKEWDFNKNSITPFDVVPGGNRKYYWICGKNHEWFAWLNNRTCYNLGCPICKTSKGEKLIAKILINMDVIFIQQKKFNDCRNKYCLPFDFYLPYFNICIEFDGEQHYRPIQYFGGKRTFEMVQHHDNIKNKYCKNNDIILLRVNYMQTDEEILYQVQNIIFNQTFGISSLFN